MGRLYVFMGKSASGKDTLYRRIRERNPELKAVISYTTRPIRAGEREGVEYHFVSEAEMEEMEKSGRIVERRRYQTVKGPWYYFTAADGQIDFSKGDFCLISTLEGYGKIRNFYGEERVAPIYIEAEDFTRLHRSLERERQQEYPCAAEVCRRFLADEEDFSDEKLREAGISPADRIQNESISEAVCQIEGILKRGR